MDENKIGEKLSKGRMVILQNMAEAYLRANNMPPTSIIHKGMKDEYGVLTDQQAAILHLYLESEYKKCGADLNEAIKAAGEEVIKGGLTKFEIQKLIEKADDMIVFLGVLEQRKSALYNKEQ